MDAMGASVCNCRVIKSCMDPISSVWRAWIAVEAVYPPQLPPWLGFMVPQKRDFATESRFRKNLSQRFGLRCCKWMPWGQVYVIVGSSNLVWTLYQVFDSSLDSSWGHLSTPTTTLIGIRGPSESRFRKNLSQRLGLRCCKWMPWGQVYVIVGSSNLVWTLYQVFDSSWDSSWGHLSTPTTTLIGIRGPSESRFRKNLSQRLGLRCCKWMPWGQVYVIVGSSNLVWTLYQVFEELG